MLENALTSLLISVTRRYAKVSTSDAGIGISGGRLVLDDVELRADRLCSPALPFSIVSGRAQRLAVRVPWSALSSSPVEVEIDNVKLIAGPRLGSDEKENVNDVKTEEKKDWEDNRWYTTLLGRLLFNVAVELRGLVLVYQDDACIGEIRLEGLRAYSCGPDWTEAIVGVEEDLQTVAMRKRVEVEGLTWFFPPTGDQKLTQHHGLNDSAENSAEGDSASRDAAKVYEARYPVLNSVDTIGRILIYAGEVDQSNGSPKSGYHMDVDLEIDKPRMSFTARQLLWLQRIIETSKGGSVQFSRSKMNGLKSPEKLEKAIDVQEDTQSEYSVASDVESYGDSESLSDRTERSGMFSTFWDAIVGEYGDDTVDDAEIALGYKSRNVPLRREKVQNERLVAQNAVRDAVHSGGFTWTLQVITPDAEARREVEKLNSILEKEKRFRERFSDVEDILEEAEERVEAAEAQVVVLQQKNADLLKEMAEFEEAASQAGQSKDAMLRQMQAALYKAETQLQILTAKKIPLKLRKMLRESSSDKKLLSEDENGSHTEESGLKDSDPAQDTSDATIPNKEPSFKSHSDSQIGAKVSADQIEMQGGPQRSVTNQLPDHPREPITSEDGLTLL
eukprot:Plantae.Rhodophyta-Hildenbrandia_rubra.ctg887.p1 GENE.Plantae.Rhodophyta-Hildenbrandia_rubra.ctg887~~Plantae.Rhodophyta-Hildenbrandia_rubra.ctg887.p1  ORF type:complete len:618 (+),score=115.09 Plantae.Rhodophyta-Hildenbrandia_rubra.ctg887:6169-8022(+)